MAGSAVSAGMEELITEVTIDAPPAEVWTVLTTFERYPEWNPSIHIEGDAVPGERLEVTFTYGGQTPATVRPKVLVADEPWEFRWRGRLFVSGLYDAEHRFLLRPLDGGERTHLTHAETFRGLLAGLVNRRLGSDLRTGFVEMNERLKRRVETSRAPERDPRTEDARQSDPRTDEAQQSTTE